MPAAEGWLTAGTEGWAPTDPTATLLISLFPGNPHHFAYVEPGPSMVGGMAISSMPFVGNYRVGDIGSIAFDVQYFGATTNTRIRLSTNKASTWEYVFDAVGAVTGGWSGRTILLDPEWSDADAQTGGWQPVGSAGPWADLLANVDAVSIEAEANGAFGIDNFSIRRRARSEHRLFAIDGGGGNAAGADLLRLDPADASVEEIVGPVGLAIEAMAFDRFSGHLYATVSDQDPVSPNQLVRIDPSTGAPTIIGPLNLPNPASTSVTDLTIAPILGSIGSRQLAWVNTPGSGGELHQIDLETGAVDPIWEDSVANSTLGGLEGANESIHLAAGGIADEPNPIFGGGEFLTGSLPTATFQTVDHLFFDDATTASTVYAMSTRDQFRMNAIAEQGGQKLLTEFGLPDLEVTKLGVLPAETEALAWQTCIPRAAIPNGGFQTGDPSGWRTTGNVEVVDYRYIDYLYPNGPYHAVLSTGDGGGPLPVSGDELARFAGLEVADLEMLGSVGTVATEGSAIQLSFEALAGEVLHVQYTFLTSEATPSAGNNDFAFASLRKTPHDGSSAKAELLSDTTGSNFEPSETPYLEQQDQVGAPSPNPVGTAHNSFERVIPEAGTYTLTLGVVDVNGSAGDSGLLLDWARLGWNADGGSLDECASRPPATLPHFYPDLDPDFPTILEVKIEAASSVPRPGLIFEIRQAENPSEVDIRLFGCRVWKLRPAGDGAVATNYLGFRGRAKESISSSSTASRLPVTSNAASLSIRTGSLAST